MVVRRARTIRSIALAALLGASMACSTSSGTPPLCTPGVSVMCTCASGRTGAQVCRADGTFAACTCEAPDGGAPSDTPDAASPSDVAVDTPAPDDTGTTDTGVDASVDTPASMDAPVDTPAVTDAPVDTPAVTDAPADAATDAATDASEGLTCIPGVCNVAEVSSGDTSRCARLTTGQVYCWGRNYLGSTASDGLRPVMVTGVDDATQVSRSTVRGCILRSGSPGRVYCWGQNAYGDLGIGSSDPAYVPTRIVDLTDATHVTVGTAHICALRSTGQIACWSGRDTIFDVAPGTSGGRSRPYTLAGISDAVAVWAGSYMTCAQRRGGQILCWGENTFGQLGDGTTTNRTAPAPVLGIDGAVEIALGGGFACARMPDGTVRCWGDNSLGQLGIGSADLDRHTTPTVVPGVTGAVQLAVGGVVACARLASGRVLCWGGNGTGQIGDGTRTDRPSPVPVAGLSDAVLVDVSPQGSSRNSGGACALRRTGRLMCWGLNDAHQLGDGTTTTVQTTPVEVVGLPSP